MKTTFKKTIAAMSAAAVVAASAAVMAVPASAASSAVVTVNSVEVTLEELAASNYEVTMPITVANSDGYTTMGFTMLLPDTLTYVLAEPNKGTSGVVASGNRVWFAVMSGNALTSSDVGYLTVGVPKDAAEGDVYTVEALNEDSDGAPAPFGKDGVDVGMSAVNGGTITIVAAPTEAPTTEAPTTTAAPTATPVTTTAATTTKKPTTGSPKTGDALPVAGVAVAVAVIGGVALVSKKRK